MLIKASAYFTLIFVLLHPVETVANSAVKSAAIRGAFIYKISKFVTWPESIFESAQSPINACFLGKGADLVVSSLMPSLVDRTVNNRTMAVMEITSETESTVLKSCHIIHFFNINQSQVNKYLQDVDSRISLLVGSNIEDFDADALIILKKIRRGKNLFRFQIIINEKKLISAPIKLDAKLIAFARLQNKK